jgi:programmed cell death 6-interacting protein
VNILFTWSNAFNVTESVSSHKVGYEKASVIFNLGAIYSHLGVNMGVQDDESMKLGAMYFQVNASLY